MTRICRPQIESGDYVPEPIQLDDEPHSEEEVSAFVNGVVDAISTDLWVSLSDTPEPTIVPVMTDDISDGLVPVTVPMNASDSGLIFLGHPRPHRWRILTRSRAPTHLSWQRTRMRCWSMCWRTIRTRMGTHSQSRPYLTRQWVRSPRTGPRSASPPTLELLGPILSLIVLMMGMVGPIPGR